MKYLKQAKKNGKLAPLLVIMCLTAGLGILAIFSVVYDFLVYRQLQTFIAPLNGMAALANNPLGRIAVGIFVLYIGLIALPRWSGYAQNPEEYEVHLDGEYI